MIVSSLTSQIEFCLQAEDYKGLKLILPSAYQHSKSAYVLKPSIDGYFCVWSFVVRLIFI